MNPRMVAIDRRVRYLLDALFGISIVAFLNDTFVKEIDQAFDRHEVRVILIARTIAVVVGCIIWCLLRLFPRPAAAVVFCVFSTIIFAMGGDMFMSVSMVVVFLFFGRRAGLVYLAGQIAFGVIVLVSSDMFLTRQGNYLGIEISTKLALAAVLGYGLRRYQDAVEQSQSINRWLEAANTDLRRNAHIQQDLLLAEERAKAASDLHDGLGHQLTVCGMSLDYAQRIRQVDPQAAWSEIENARGVIGEALTEVRTWARTLHPLGVSRGVGLASLDSIADAFRGTDIDVHVSLPEELPELNEMAEVFVTRFVQEGLANAVRHGKAANVWIEAKRDEGQLIIEVFDDGKGGIVTVDGFGLRSLRERVAVLRGQLSADSCADGFRLRAVFPLTSTPELVSL